MSMNVDDVFLMLMQKRIRQILRQSECRKLLGITVEQIRKDISVLGELHSEDTKDPKKDHLKGDSGLLNSRNGILSMFIRKQENDAGFIVLQWVVR